ncbi:hypothetical protein ABPG72_013910 [Tetrahymena utriculariae]
MNLLYANNSVYKFFQSDQNDLLEKMFQLQNQLQVDELQKQKSKKAQKFIINNNLRTDQQIQTPKNNFPFKMKSYNNIMQHDMPPVYRKLSAIPTKNNPTQNNIYFPSSHSPPSYDQQINLQAQKMQKQTNSFSNQQVSQNGIQSKNTINQQSISQTPNNYDNSLHCSQFANYILQSSNNTPNERQKSNSTVPLNGLNRNAFNNSLSHNNNGSTYLIGGSKKNIQEETININFNPINQFFSNEECLFTHHYPVQDTNSHINIQKKYSLSKDLSQEVELITEQANLYIQQNTIEQDCILDKSFSFTSRIVLNEQQKQDSNQFGFFSSYQINQNNASLHLNREHRASVQEKLMKQESFKSNKLTKESSLQLPQIQTSLSKNFMHQRTNTTHSTLSQLQNQNYLNQIISMQLNHQKSGELRVNDHHSTKNKEEIEQNNISDINLQQQSGSNQNKTKYNTLSQDKIKYPQYTSSLEQTELKAIISCQEGEDAQFKSTSSKDYKQFNNTEETATLGLINFDEEFLNTEKNDSHQLQSQKLSKMGSPNSLQQNKITQQSNNQTFPDKINTSSNNLQTQKSSCSINLNQQSNLNQAQSIQLTFQPKKSNITQQLVQSQNPQQNFVFFQPNQSSQVDFANLDQQNNKPIPSINWITSNNNSSNNNNNQNSSFLINNQQSNVNGNINTNKNQLFVQKCDLLSPAANFTKTESSLLPKLEKQQNGQNINLINNKQQTINEESINYQQGQYLFKKQSNAVSYQQQSLTKISSLTKKRTSYLHKNLDFQNGEKTNREKQDIEWSDEDLNQSTREVDITIFAYILNQQPVILLLVRDVTHRSYIKLLQDISKKKSKMVSFVSHELRTPLNSIIAMLESMKNKPDIDYIETALMNSKYLLCISNDLLDLAQIKVNKFQIRKKTFNLKELILEILEMFQIQAERQHIDLVIDYPQDMRSFITSDKNRVRQVLINLIGNAFKFTLTGSITIKVQIINNVLFQVHVVDTGIGIKEGDLNKLFKTFGKLDGEESVKLNEQGVGLGLVISNMIAYSLSEQKEGLTVKSEYSKGTSFQFKIQDWNAEQSEKSQEELNAQIVEDEEEQKFNKIAEENEGNNVIKNIQKYNSFTVSKNKFSEELSPQKIKFGIKETQKMQSPTDSQISQSKRASRPLSPLKQSNTFEHKNSTEKERSTIRLLTDFQQLWKERRRTKLQLIKISGIQDITNLQDNPKVQIDYTNPKNKLTKIATQINIKEEWGQVLIVDDNMNNIVAMKCLLSAICPDIKCNYAIRGQGAEDLVRNRFMQQKDEGYAIIFMDIVMPEQDGIITGQKINQYLQENNITQTKIIACSGYDDEQEKRKCLEVGMSDYLVKPVFKDKLTQVAQQYMKQFIK